MKKILVVLLVVFAMVATMALAACKPAETKGDSTSTAASTTTSTAASTVESTPASTPAESTPAAESTQAPASEENAKGDSGAPATSTEPATSTTTPAGDGGCDGYTPAAGEFTPFPADAVLTVYGNIDGVSWEECATQNKAQTLTLQDDGTYKTGPITFEAGQQIQIINNGSFEGAYPANRYTLTEYDAHGGSTETRAVVFNPTTGEITFVDFDMGNMSK